MEVEVSAREAFFEEQMNDLAVENRRKAEAYAADVAKIQMQSRSADPLAFAHFSMLYESRSRSGVCEHAVEIRGHQDVAGEDEVVGLGYAVVRTVVTRRVFQLGHSLWDICYQCSQGMSDFYLAVFGDPSSPLTREYEEAMSTDSVGLRLCYIETIYLEPQFRGRGVSLLVLDSIIKTFAEEWEANMIALHPGPMARVKHFTVDGVQTPDDGPERLAAHYGKLGFHTVRPKVEGRMELPLMELRRTGRQSATGTFEKRNIKEIVPGLGPMIVDNSPV